MWTIVNANSKTFNLFSPFIALRDYAGTHMALSLRRTGSRHRTINKSANQQPPGQKSFLCSEHTEQKEETLPSCRDLPHRICASSASVSLKPISKAQFPWAGQDTGQLVTSILKGTWEKLHGRELLIADFLFLFLISDILPGPLKNAVNALSVNIRKVFPNIWWVFGVFPRWLEKMNSSLCKHRSLYPLLLKLCRVTRGWSQSQHHRVSDKSSVHRRDDK